MPPRKDPGTPSSNSNGVTLTQREQEILLTAGQCFIEEPRLDMDKFMTLAGFASKASASNAWRNIRMKLGLTAKKDSPMKKEGPVTPASGAKRGRKRKVVQKEDEDSEDEGFGDESPTAGKRVKMEPKEEGDAEEGDLDYAD